MKIKIKNLKSITELVFELPTSPGVYILTSANGSGKTSLLNSISFLFDSFALKNSFISGSNKFDSYKKARITYIDDTNNELTYKFTNINWHPEKRNGKYKVSSQYSSGKFLRIDQSRILPKDDYLTNENIKPCVFAVDVANVLLNDDFLTLSTVSIKGKRSAFVCNDRTERYFSSGELAVVQIIKNIHNAKNNSLILIDETEISLHPLTQINLLDYLKKISAEKQIIFIVSSHSQTLIKSTSNKNLYFINKNFGEHEIINPCYPSLALSAISPVSDYYSDRILLFEDSEAIIYFNELKKVKNALIKNTVYHMPLPIGGWPQLAVFTSNANKHLKKSQNQKFKAIFDNDVKKSDLKTLPVFNDIEHFYDKLQLSPEITPIIWLITNRNALLKLNNHFSQNILKSSFPSLLKYNQSLKSIEIKKIWNNFIDEYQSFTACSVEDIKKAVYSIWINENVTDQEAARFFGVIFS